MAPAKKPKRNFWSAGDEARLAELYSDTPMSGLISVLQRSEQAIYSKAASMGLNRSEAYLASKHACRLRKGDGVGEKTQFKPGQNPHNWNPIGHERLTKDGYLQRKMTDSKCTRKDYRFVHHMVWEEVNGPVPPGHALVFRDNNRANIVIGNLEMITRAELCRRNTIHRYPPELKDLIRLQKKLERTIRKRADEKQND